jgi:hypothetical protein
MSTLEVHAAVTLAPAASQVIVGPSGAFPPSPAPAPGIGIQLQPDVSTLTILVTNTGANPVTGATLKRSLDAAGARFSPPDGSVVIPGGSLASGASWEIAYPANWPATRWCQLTLTSELGTTVAVDFLGGSFSVGIW